MIKLIMIISLSRVSCSREDSAGVWGRAIEIEKERDSEKGGGGEREVEREKMVQVCMCVYERERERWSKRVRG